MRATMTLCSTVALLAAPALAQAEGYTLLVANRDTPAARTGEGLADNQTVFFEPKLFKAFSRAAELLNKPGAHTVHIKIAGGPQTGQSGGGQWLVPDLQNPEGTLIIAGGYAPDFVKRDPFAFPSELVTVAGRPGPVLEFSSKSKLKECVISGLFIDGAPSNKYDARTNSILKGQSRTYTLIGIRQMVTPHLVVSDNVFLNGAQGAVDPYVTPVGKSSVVDIENNFVVNTIMPMSTQTGGSGLKALNIRNNSFLLNWPYNPDSTSSNVGALTLYHKECCEELNIERNIFAYNPGGAMQHDWPENRMPKMGIKDNLFFMNAALFGDARPDAGFFTGKFGPNPKHLVVTATSAADDYAYAISGNVSFDPKVPIALVDLKAADSSGVTAKKSVMNDVRAMFGASSRGGAVAIKNYAPRIGIDPRNLPFPAEPKAGAFGVQRTKIRAL